MPFFFFYIRNIRRDYAVGWYRGSMYLRKISLKQIQWNDEIPMVAYISTLDIVIFTKKKKKTL